MNTHWRLIRHGPAPGAWNMAVDELLLERAAEGAPPALRLYAWERPTLSLGYFQSLGEVPPGAAERFALVRRPTGGGAILHDREVTYSVAAREADLPGAALYDRMNEAIIGAAASLGVAAEVRGEARGVRAQRGPFFCFARAGATDIIVASCAEAKLAGSAQRRRRGAVLQHGSVLLAAGEPGAVGLSDVLGRAVAFDEAAEALVRSVASVFGCGFTEGDLAAAEVERAEAIHRRRYGSAGWLERGNRSRERISDEP